MANEFELYKGDPVLSLVGADLTTSYSVSVASFQAGACGGVGVSLWCKAQSAAAGSITTITVALEVSRDGTNWAPLLSTLHLSGGTTNVEQALTVSAGGGAVYRNLTVNPIHIGSAPYVRVKAKANAAGTAADDLILVYASGA